MKTPNTYIKSLNPLRLDTNYWLPTISTSIRRTMNNIYTNIKPIKPKTFMEAVAGSGIGYVVLSYASNPSSKKLMSESLDATKMDSVVDRAVALSKKSPVYFGINRRSHKLAFGERGGNEEVGNISIIGMDIHHKFRFQSFLKR